MVRTTSLSLNAAPTSSSNGLGGEVGRISCVQGGAVTTTSGPAWWASAFGTIIDGAGAVWVPAGCYDLCTLFKADSDFGSGMAGWWCKLLLGDSCSYGTRTPPKK